MTYTVTDGESSTNGTIKVTVDNREPTAGSDTASGMGLSGSINVLANDTDPDGGALTVTGASIDSVRRDPPPQPTTDPDGHDHGAHRSRGPRRVNRLHTIYSHVFRPIRPSSERLCSHTPSSMATAAPPAERSRSTSHDQ